MSRARLAGIHLAALLAMAVAGCERHHAVGIEVTPVALTMRTSEAAAVSAQLLYSDGSHEPLSSAASWRSSDPSVVRVELAGSSARATAGTVGDSVLTVTDSGVSASIPVKVEGAALISAPLRVSPSNPRYFQDGAGRAVLLAGAHTWLNLQDIGDTNPPKPFDYDTWLASLTAHHQNFFRLWTQENSRWILNIDRDDLWIRPLPYVRSGPGLALDGLPKFDLTRFDEEYFARLRDRVRKAQERGIYVAVMLFNGWTVAREKGSYSERNTWHSHPFNRANNINQVDGDVDGDDSGEETHELRSAPILALQEAYVRKVVDTVNEFPNVLYEISNESHAGSVAWQYRMIEFLRSYEATKPYQHPIGMTATWPDGDNEVLYRSPADWISPTEKMDAPTSTDGRKVIVADSDHLCGICGNPEWPWKAFLRGQNVLFMDLYNEQANVLDPGDPHRPVWEQVRRALGRVRALAERVDLSRLVPHGDKASNGLCLATEDDAHPAFLVYVAAGGSVTVDLRGTDRVFETTWFSTGDAVGVRGEPVQGGAWHHFKSDRSQSAVLYLH